jgi:VIT1/CCC1 family predicted Fe2+/Mn2+ transporter
VPPASRVVAHAARVVVDAYSTEATVYGIVLVAALTAVGWEYNTDLQVLGFILGTTLIFWATHIFARAAVAHNDDADEPLPVKKAVTEALRHSEGMILAMLLPSVFLLLATIGWLDEYVAYFIALLIPIALLMAIGYVVALRNRRPWWRRLIAAVVTGLLGAVVIVLGIFAH